MSATGTAQGAAKTSSTLVERTRSATAVMRAAGRAGEQQGETDDRDRHEQHEAEHEQVAERRELQRPEREQHRRVERADIARSSRDQRGEVRERDDVQRTDETERHPGRRADRQVHGRLDEPHHQRHDEEREPAAAEETARRPDRRAKPLPCGEQSAVVWCNAPATTSATAPVTPAATTYGNGPERKTARRDDEDEDRCERERVEHALCDDGAEDDPPRRAEHHHAHHVTRARRQRVVAHVADRGQAIALAAPSVDVRARKQPVPAFSAQERRARVEGERDGQQGDGVDVQRDPGRVLPGGPTRRSRPAQPARRRPAGDRPSASDLRRRSPRGEPTESSAAGSPRSVSRLRSYTTSTVSCLPVGPGDAEEHREPAPEPETTLLDELLPEDERTSDDVEVDAALLRHAVHEDVERAPDVVRQLDLTPRFHLYTMPLGVRRIALATLATSAVALVFSAVALAGNAGFLPGQAASPNAERVTVGLHLRRDPDRPHPRRRRGNADRVRHQVPPARAPAYRRGTADSRLDTTRGDLDGRPGRDPRRDRVVRLLRAPGDHRCAGRIGGELDDDHGRGPPVLLALPLPERCDLDRHDDRTGEPGRARTRRRPRLRRQPFVVGARFWTEVRRDSRQGEHDVVQGTGGHLCRAVRRAVRHPARPHGRPRRRRPASGVRRVRLESACEQERRRSWGGRNGKASASSAIGSTTPTSGRPSAATRCSPSRCRSRRCCGAGGSTCRPSATTGREPRSMH